jgi:hypothetical protein
VTHGEAEAIRPALLALAGFYQLWHARAGHGAGPWDECQDPECQKAQGIYRAARAAIEEDSGHGIP